MIWKEGILPARTDAADYITMTMGYDFLDLPQQVKYINTLLEGIASNEIEGGIGISDLQYLKNILSMFLTGGANFTSLLERERTANL